jgi:putative molybdopterin biosynthesis protein
MLYTIQEVSEILKVHFQTTLKLVRSGAIKSVKVGRQWRISEQDLKNYLEDLRK